MTEEINPELLTRLEKYKLYKDVFVTQYKQRKVTQRAASRLRNQEPKIAIGFGGQMNVLTPGELRQLRQKELQDVFGPQQSSLLSKKIKQDKILGSQKAIVEARALQAQALATQPVAQTKSVSGATKTESTLADVGKKIQYSPVYIDPVTRQRVTTDKTYGRVSKLVAFEKTIDGEVEQSLLYKPGLKGIGRPTEELFNVERTLTSKGVRVSRVKAGRTIKYGDRVYKGGNFVPTHVSMVDQIIGTALSGQPIRGELAAYMEENLPSDFLAKVLQEDTLLNAPNGVMDPDSLVHMKMSHKKEWMAQDEQIIKEKRRAEFEADKEQKLADYRARRESFKAEREAAIADAKARRAEERIKAFISSKTGDPNAKITIFDSALAEADTAVSQVTAKKPISMKTAERLMSSHTLAAGVAAGGLGLMYAMNRRRGEEQVGR